MWSLCLSILVIFQAFYLTCSDSEIQHTTIFVGSNSKKADGTQMKPSTTGLTASEDGVTGVASVKEYNFGDDVSEDGQSSSSAIKAANSADCNRKISFVAANFCQALTICWLLKTGHCFLTQLQRLPLRNLFHRF